jgi:hypothetical protein
MTQDDPAPLRADLKLLVIRKLRLHGGPLGLDSIDILELVLAVEERYGVKIGDEERGRKAFGSIAALAGFILEARAARGPGGPPAA